MVLAALALIVFPAAAHAPADIKLSYDDAAQQLTVIIAHAVDNPETHYIRNVKIKVNNAVSVDVDYKSQPSQDSVTYTYSVPLNPGDTIWVTATCNQGPSLTKTMDIASPSAAAVAASTQGAAPPQTTAVPAPAAVPTQKSALSLLPVIGAAAFLLVQKR
jgi:hypothetical protein